MSKFNYLVQQRPFDSDEPWLDVARYTANAYTGAFEEFEQAEDDEDNEYRLVVRIQPCANAPMERVCQYGEGAPAIYGSPSCTEPAVADAPGEGGRWGYWCADHLTERRPSMINVITSDPLELVLLEG